MTILILKNFTIFDGKSEELTEGGSIVIENDRIMELSTTEARAGGAEVVDLNGRFVMPGLLDLHFHAYGISFNMSMLDQMPVPQKVAHAARLLKGALHRARRICRPDRDRRRSLEERSRDVQARRALRDDHEGGRIRAKPALGHPGRWAIAGNNDSVLQLWRIRR